MAESTNTSATAVADALGPSRDRRLKGPDRSRLSAIRGLLVDIDDTITSPRPIAGQQPASTGSLMQVLRTAGTRLGGLPEAEVDRRMERIKREINWWHWSDFIVELELNPKEFWEFAYQTECSYLQATGPEIGPALTRLRHHGYLLFVTSNNPSSGILHKLRLAGLGEIHGCNLFSQLLGGTELHSMKWEPQYWKKVLAHVGMDAHEVAIIGDNPRDDWEVPRSIGISCAFLINRNADLSSGDGDGLYHVQSFTEVADILLKTT